MGAGDEKEQNKVKRIEGCCAENSDRGLDRLV